MLIDKIHLEPGEEVLVQARRHWFVLASRIFSLFVAALSPLLFLWFINHSIIGNLDLNINLNNYAAEIAFLYCLILVLIWAAVFSVWTNHYLDTLTVTDRRVILTNQKGFFWRNVASFRLERMQDVNTDINGMIATMLNFGTIQVETASDAEEEFKAAHMPDPGKIKSIILQAADNRISTSPNHSGVETE